MPLVLLFKPKILDFITSSLWSQDCVGIVSQMQGGGGGGGGGSHSWEHPPQNPVKFIKHSQHTNTFCLNKTCCHALLHAAGLIENFEAISNWWVCEKMLELLLIHTAGWPSVHYQPTCKASTLHLYSHHRHHIRNDHFHYYQGHP